MGIEQAIREGFIRIAQNFGPPATMVARVKSVDEAAGTVVLVEEVPEGEPLEIPDVRLRPVTAGEAHVLQVPTPGSWVLAGRIENDDEWIVLSVDAISKVIFKTAAGEFVVDEKISLKTASCEISLDDKVDVKNASTSLGKILQGMCDAMLSIYAPKDIAKITQAKLEIETIFK